jgi:hypothetical protein
VRKVVKLGWVGLLGLLILAAIGGAVISNQPKPQQQPVSDAAQPRQTAAAEADASKFALPKVGETTKQQGWELTLVAFGPYDRFAPVNPAATKNQRALLVADMRIKNLQTSPRDFTLSDFTLKAGDGREFKAAEQTATIEKGFVTSQAVQPGLTAETRVVFAADPTLKVFTLAALGMQFEVQAP